MKGFNLHPWLILGIQALFLFTGVWLIWYVFYYYSLLWLEGYSYFTSLPDLKSVLALFPDDLFKYVGAYFLQFFYKPALGAAIQAGFATWIMLCTGMMVMRLFKTSSGILWLSFIPIPFYMFGQFWDLSLERSIIWCLSVFLLMCIVWIVTIGKRLTISMNNYFQHYLVMILIPILAFSLSAYFLLGYDKGNKNQEMFGKLEYLGDHQQWEEILKLIPPQEAQQNELKRRYALLALSETGRLSEQMFRYGITNPREFLFFNREEPFCRNFNALFYRSINLPNEVIHQCYQLGIQSSFGFSFSVLRRLVDTYIELKDYALAKKYLDILSHSSFKKKWVEGHLPKLESIKDMTPSYTMEGAPFTIGTFLETMSSVYDRYPDNRKYADLLLCGILADKNGNSFYQVFKIIAQHLYANGERIPRYYEEALLLISPHEKDILEKYNISKDSQERYNVFMQLVKTGRINVAKRKYPDSFWSYIY